jgi:hypothetical protein
MNKNHKGFSAIPLLLIIVLIGIIGGTGWYVYNSNKKTNELLNSADKLNTPNKPKSTSTSSKPLKEYKSEDYKFSFQYPSNWIIREDLKDYGRGEKEGDIIAISANDTKVYFSPNLGGKGGDCWDDEANTRTTRTCQTLNILSVEKLETSTVASPVYFYKASVTDSQRDGGKTHYLIYIQNGKYAYTKPATYVGAVLEGYDAIDTSKTSLSIRVTGRNDDKNDSQTFFDTQEIKEASSILKSFKLLQ